MGYPGSGLTGHGKVDMGTDATILEIDTNVTTLGGLTDVHGNGTVPRIFHAGWIGVGYDHSADPLPYDEVYWETFLSIRYRSYRIYPLQVFAQWLFWDLEDGVVANVNVYW